MEEIYICTQNLKGFTHADVLVLPTYERRFYLGLLTRDVRLREEKVEEMKEQTQTTGGKGNRKTRVSGEALKTRMKNGDVPMK